MTVLIGASVLLIAASAVALVFGWTGADQSLIWTSIAATSAAAVTLALAYFRSRSETVPSGARSEAAPQQAAEAAPVTTAAQPSPTEAAPSVEPAVVPVAEEAKPEPPDTQETPAAAPARKKPTVRKLEVVAIASTKKFHRPECRYASSSRGEKLSKGEARKKGFAPCGVCKP